MLIRIIIGKYNNKEFSENGADEYLNKCIINCCIEILLIITD